MFDMVLSGQLPFTLRKDHLVTQHYPITLHEDEQSKVIQLSGEYHPTSLYETIDELKAIFTASGCDLYRIHGMTGNSQLDMSAAELNALISAWETFHAEKELKKLTEDRRIADIFQQVRELIADTPITLEEHPATETNTLYWTVHFDAQDISRHAQNTDALLKHTKDMKAIWEHHQAAQHIHTQVKAIKESCPAIKIKGNPITAPWHVSIDTPDIYGEWAQTPEQLLERVKAAKAKHEEWQQDQLIKQQEDYSDIG